MAKIDAAVMTALLARMSKLIGSPELVQVATGKKNVTLKGSSERDGAHLELRDKLIEPGSPIVATVPFEVLRLAIKGRGQVDLDAEGNTLSLKSGGRYSASLTMQPNKEAPAVETGKDDKVRDSKALKVIMERHGRQLALQDLVDESRSLLVNLKWGEGKYQAAVTDNQHAVYIEGKSEDIKAKGSLALYAPELGRIAEIGGDFVITDAAITATSEGATLRFRRIPNDESVIKVPVDKVAQLALAKAEWSVETTSDALATALENVSAVIEYGKGIQLSESSKGHLTLRAQSAHGDIKARIEATERTGKNPIDVTLNPRALAAVIGAISGPVTLSRLGSDLRVVSRGKDDATTVAGMLRLMASA